MYFTHLVNYTHQYSRIQSIMTSASENNIKTYRFEFSKSFINELSRFSDVIKLHWLHGLAVDGGELTLVLGRDVQRWAERNAEVLPLPVLPSTVQDALATNINGSVEVQVCP